MFFSRQAKVTAGFHHRTLAHPASPPTLPRSDIYEKLSHLSRFLGDKESEKLYAELAARE
jgi:hypothetical protein